MKIKFYFAVIIVASLVFGFMLEYVISEKQTKVTQISNKVIEDRFYLEEYENYLNNLKQYFISIDLILGSDQTYLMDNTLQKSAYLLTSINKFKSNADLFRSTELLDTSEKSIKQLNNIIGRSSKIGSFDREPLLNKLLVQADGVIAQLIAATGDIRYLAEEIAEQRKVSLEDKQNDVSLLKFLGPILFGAMLIVLWLWSYKRVCDPLNKLKQLAEKSMDNSNTIGVIDKGPTEVIELSNSLTELTKTLSYQASHDSLTQLYNRREFESKLNQSISEIGSYSDGLKDVLCYLDLDQFKIVNDTCGHIAGDVLLKMIATTIQNSIRKSDFLARVGGDEFCILLYKCDQATATEICNDIRNDIDEIRYSWDDKVFRISASIGITEIDGMQETAQDVLNAADTACSVAKELGRNRVHAFSASDTQLAQKRSEMSCMNRIHLALEENRLILYRQNIVPICTNDNEKQHYEILVRIISLDNTLISPSVFLPITERYHFATKIDKWVILNVCKAFAENPALVEETGLCNINLSGQSLSDGEMHDFILEKLNEYNVPANKICFEITETAAVTDINNAKTFIKKLKKYGCMFALDDFGSGLSSFQYLKNLPVDFVKIDGSFVKNVAIDNFDVATVKSINDIAKASGKQTVAEFVENKDIVDKLKEIGVDYAQGYYFDKPAPLNLSFDDYKKVSNW